MIIINPEFHRNLWLKFSTFRLAAMPIFLLCYLYLASTSWGADDTVLFGTTLPICFVVLCLFGTYEAAKTLSSEIKGNTWDFQKMSAIGPWQLAIGKLFGATSYAWYFGIPLLAVMAFNYPHDAFGASTPSVGVFLMASVLGAVSGHASALLVSLASLHTKRMRVFLSLILGVVVASWVFKAIIGYDLHLDGMVSADGLVSWHGIMLSKTHFDLYSVLFVLFWVVVAIQRLLRLELQYKNAPLVWAAFVVSTAAYVAGLYPQDTSFLRGMFDSAMPYWLGFCVVAALLYMKMLEESKDIMPYKRFIAAWRARDWQLAFMNVPRWAVTLCLALPLLVLLHMTFPADNNRIEFSMFNLGLGILLFTLRDGLILHAILLGRTGRFVGFKLAFYYFVMYFMAVNVTMDGAFDTRETVEKVFMSGGGLSFFLPTGAGGLLGSCGAVVLQCVGAAWFLNYRLKLFTKEE
jgi:hypothetical protein|tara:strand:- start:41019 stop:42407 length:1389 start_codon:yes stop_codon:yes gene_type:complete